MVLVSADCAAFYGDEPRKSRAALKQRVRQMMRMSRSAVAAASKLAVGT